jgi:3-oxoacyl-[acyl-carrier-protein] synthase-3
MDLEHFEAGAHFYRLDVERVHPMAESVLPTVIQEGLAQAGVAPDALALALVHYLDPRVARRAAERVPGLAAERIVATAEGMGHVAAAGLPVALVAAIRDGRVGRGDLVCLAAFGAGFAWGSAVLRL